MKSKQKDEADIRSLPNIVELNQLQPIAASYNHNNSYKEYNQLFIENELKYSSIWIKYE